MPWSRRKFLGTGGMVAGGALAGVRAMAGGGPDIEPSDGPNILYIYTDQLRNDALAISGNPVAYTPNIDRLARGGVQFERCYTNSPLCRPARLSMATGVHPSVHGVQTNSDPEVMPLDVPSHIRAMRDISGYRTALVGKSHLHTGDGHMDDWAHIMSDWGYSEVVETSGEFMSRNKQSGFTDALTAMTPPAATDLYEVHQDFMNHYAEHWHRLKEWETQPIDAAPWGLGLEHHIDTFVAETVAAWLHTVERDRPWYMQCNFPGPHPPWNAPSRFLDYYLRRIDDIPVGVFEAAPRPWSKLVQMMHEEVGAPRSIDQVRLMRAKYLARVSMLDILVGRVLAALEESGQADNTWVILSSDHGEMMGDQRLVGKIVFFEPSVRIPLIVRPPTSLGATPFRSDALTDQMDVVATILDLGGAHPDLLPEPPEGVSLVRKVLDGPDMPDAHVGRDSIFAEVYNHAMLFDGRYKVVVDETTMEAVEVYDLDADANEQTNFVGTADYADVEASALAQVTERLAE